MTTYTGTVTDLAREIIRTHDLSLCPILADAMQDAGCDDRDVLNELRAETAFGRKPFASAVGGLLIDLLGVRVERVIDEDGRNARRRTRGVDADGYAADVAGSAVVRGRSWKCGHGGSVPNNYGYAAVTDGVLAAAVYDAEANTVRVGLWAGEVPANKVTNRGVAALFGYGDLCDSRVGETRKDAARTALYAAVVGAEEAVPA